jgi:putative transposase
MAGALAKGSAIRYLTQRGRCSRRRACVVPGMSGSLLQYVAERRRGEAVSIRRILHLASRNGRYGYRLIAMLLRRDDWEVNRKRVHRIWKAEGFRLLLRRARRPRVAPVGEILNRADYPKDIWSYDFAQDKTEPVGKLRTLVINRRLHARTPGHQDSLANTSLGGSGSVAAAIPPSWYG